MGLCFFLHSHAIPVSLFERQSAVLHRNANFDVIREAVGILVQFSFVRRTTVHDVDIDGDKNYDSARDFTEVHRLVQEVIHESSILNNEIIFIDYHDLHVRKIDDVYIHHIRNVIAQVDWRHMDSETRTFPVTFWM